MVRDFGLVLPGLGGNSAPENHLSGAILSLSESMASSNWYQYMYWTYCPQRARQG